MRTLSLILATFGLLTFALPAVALDGDGQSDATDVAAPPDGSDEADEAEAVEGGEEGSGEEAEQEEPKPE